MTPDQKLGPKLHRWTRISSRLMLTHVICWRSRLRENRGENGTELTLPKVAQSWLFTWSCGFFLSRNTVLPLFDVWDRWMKKRFGSGTPFFLDSAMNVMRRMQINQWKWWSKRAQLLMDETTLVSFDQGDGYGSIAKHLHLQQHPDGHVHAPLGCSHGYTGVKCGLLADLKSMMSAWKSGWNEKKPSSFVGSTLQSLPWSNVVYKSHDRSITNL